MGRLALNTFKRTLSEGLHQVPLSIMRAPLILRSAFSTRFRVASMTTVQLTNITTDSFFGISMFHDRGVRRIAMGRNAFALDSKLGRGIEKASSLHVQKYSRYQRRCA